MSESSGSQVERCSWSCTDSLSDDDDGMFQEIAASLFHSKDDDRSIACDEVVLRVTPMASQTLVYNFDADSQVSKRRMPFAVNTEVPAKRSKLFNLDVQVPLELPKPVVRPLRTRPVCTFLHYFGSRLPKDEAEDPQSTIAESKCLSATLALFPVCPCKLVHQVLKDCVATAPPILTLLSATNICQQSTPFSTSGASQLHQADDLNNNCVEGDPKDEDLTKETGNIGSVES
jgi:hypothetical protein